MKKILQLVLLILLATTARAQTNQNSDPAAFSVSSVPNTIPAGGKGQIEVVVANLGTDPLIANTFLVNITFDPRYLVVDTDPARPILDPVSGAGWEILDYGDDYVNLLNSGAVVNSADAVALLISVKPKSASYSGTAGIAVNVSVNPDMVGSAGDTDGTNNFLSGQVVLPVKLVSFNVIREGEVANLNWVTSEEVNASHFDVQRSVDAKTWSTLGRVDAKGAGRYSFIDKEPLGSVNLYYRLLMVDIDNSYAYSNIRSVNFDHVMRYTVYPNPATDRVAFTNISFDQIKQVQVLDVGGRLVFKQETFNENSIPLSRVANGTYIIRLHKTDGSVLNMKLVIAR